MTEPAEVQFKLRLPAQMKATLDDAAQQGGRSLSAEIVHRLQRSFEHDRHESFELLQLRLSQMNDAAEHLTDFDQRLELLRKGDAEAIEWLRERFPSDSLEDLTDIAEQVRDVLQNSLNQLKGSIADIVKAMKDNTAVPSSAKRLTTKLSR